MPTPSRLIQSVVLLAALELPAYRSVGAWDLTGRVPGAARAAALSSIVIWVGVITCGRLIAYF
jgi:hypothetical protein